MVDLGLMQSGILGKLGASLSPDGRFTGTISGVSGQEYVIEASTNLSKWSSLTNLTITNGTGQFADQATNREEKYYRAVLVGK